MPIVQQAWCTIARIIDFLHSLVKKAAYTVTDAKGIERPTTLADARKREYQLDYVLAQDMVGWYAQGTNVDRTKEHLGVSDVNVIAYRKMLKEQIERVARGEEPLNVFWDPTSTHRPELTIPGMEGRDDGKDYGRYLTQLAQERITFFEHEDRYTPDIKQLMELYDRAEQFWTRQRQGAVGAAR